MRGRNLAPHAYNEQLADEIYNKIKGYYPILQATFDTLKAKFYSMH
jgi:hypothetical protein